MRPLSICFLIPKIGVINFTRTFFSLCFVFFFPSVKSIASYSHQICNRNSVTDPQGWSLAECIVKLLSAFVNLFFRWNPGYCSSRENHLTRLEQVCFIPFSLFHSREKLRCTFVLNNRLTVYACVRLLTGEKCKSSARR